MASRKPEKRGWVDAGEFMAELEADPAWVAARDRMYAERERKQAKFQRAEAPLTKELQRAGYRVKSAWDLMSAPGTYAAAVPILLKHLTRPYPVKVREGIARALAIPETKEIGWKKIVRLYIKETNVEVKDALAIAIEGATQKDVLEDVIALVRDKHHGSSRILLLSALRRLLGPRKKAVFMALRTDPDLKVEVALILKSIERNRNRRKKGR